MNTKKYLKKIHRWIGLASGIVVFILGITGALFVFEEEIKSVVYNDFMFVENTTENRMPLDSLLSLAQTELGIDKLIQTELGTDKPFIRIYIPNNKKASYQISAFETVKGSWNYFEEYKYYRTVFIDPYTGKILKNQNTKYEFLQLVLFAHMNLLLSRELGSQVTGAATIIFILALLSGVFIFWPKKVKKLKSRLTFKWKSTTRWRRKNYDLHNILGFYSIIFALIIALTGLMWSYKWSRTALMDFADLFSTKSGKKMITIEDNSKHISKDYPYEIALNSVKTEFPNAVNYISIWDMEKPIDFYVTVSNSHKEIRLFNPKNGNPIKKSDFKEFSLGYKLLYTKYQIHVGSILGLPNKILWFFVSLISAMLPVTGFVIWWGKRKKKVSNKFSTI